MKKFVLGITAHVDSGKTTLAEALLYTTGQIRKLGRVDSGNSFLDTDQIERNRGITVFSSRAEIEWGDSHITLLDTPGHVDFSAEAERTMPVLDYAILVISGTDGVQNHTVTLWNLLRKYEIPVFIFVNKTDLITPEKSVIIERLQKNLSSACVDFSGSEDDIQENSALCCEELMNNYIEKGSLSDEEIVSAIADRRIFPCFFGSALRMEGVEKLLSALDRYTRCPKLYDDFGAKVYKITYDDRGNRLTHMKIMGGRLAVRDSLNYKDKNGEEISEKISSLRFCFGGKFKNAEFAEVGDICAVTGLENTYAGQGIGCVRNSDRAVLEPVMTYNAILPENVNNYEALKDLRLLEDEDPQLHIIWDEQTKQISLQLMGAVQLEVISQIVKTRFGFDISFGNGAIAYKETIKNTVEGVGHYEPLRHYAEVHVLIEPLERGSGVVFDTICSEDSLDRNWQRLILSNLEEKIHLGVLTGSPVTDVKITLVSGKAHLKHTEGGDFRQASYRAVRQGLRSAQSVLLEPYYKYQLEIPSECVGRAISDLQNMSAEFDSPQTDGDFSVIAGTAPVSEINGYQQDIINYSRGKGRLTLIPCGYRECHNADEIIKSINYDCDADTENSADSVFCSHGAGHIVKWNEVQSHMHLPAFTDNSRESTETKSRNVRRYIEKFTSDEELMEIFERTYGKINTDRRKAFQKTKKSPDYSKPVKIPDYKGNYLLVDGYNIIFSWDELKTLAEKDLESARIKLMDMMCNYQGYAGCNIILVFDAYRVKGQKREIIKYFNINIVYTQEAETADSYIERISHELAKDYRVRVATSDALEQMIILGNGAMRVSANEFHMMVENAENSIREYIDSYKN